MRLISCGFAIAVLVAACGSTAVGEDAAGDAAVDVSGTDAAIDSDLPPTDAVQDAQVPDGIGNDLAPIDAANDTGWDAGPDIAPDTFNNGCCQDNSTCAKGSICIPGKDCVPAAPAGKCWFDSDCKSGKCENANVCPCTADCSFSYVFGTCSDNPGSCCGGDKGSCTSSEVCIASAHICKPSGIQAGTCWTNDDCKVGTCEGASVCPCGAACALADRMGTCVGNVAPGGCCNTNGGVCASGESCANGNCKPKNKLPGGMCWNDSDCGGGTCSDVNVCPCGADCFAADTPGTCGYGPTSCTTIDPSSFGVCQMVIGYVFDGKTCVLASGCGCAPKCNAVYPSLATCQKSCGI